MEKCLSFKHTAAFKEDSVSITGFVVLKRSGACLIISLTSNDEEKGVYDNKLSF